MKLSIDKVRIDYPFRIRRNTYPFDALLRHEYKFDFEVFLPSKGFNLQRDFCWTLMQKQQFILSILKENPIPKVAVIQYKSKDGEQVYQVIDGKQRISTYIEFYKGEFYITVDGTNYYYDDFDEMAQYHYNNFSFVGDLAYEYWDEPISDDDKIKWFMQVNFAGTPQDLEHFNKLTISHSE
jgi:hypothetical protein